jgi:hypothetical protein
VRRTSVLAVEFFGGVVVGVLSAVVGAFGAFILCVVVFGPLDPPPGPGGPPFGWYALPTLVGCAAGSLGSAIGAGVGVWVIGKLLGQQGSLVLAMCGSLLGNVFGCGCGQLVSQALEGYDMTLLPYDAPGLLYDLPFLLTLLPAFVISSALAVLGYHLLGKRHDPRASKALDNHG